MVCTVLMCCALLGAEQDGGAASSANTQADLSVYQAAKIKAGKTADAHVRLALWCEAHGLTAERVKHLSLAVLYDPSNALARGLMGLVAYQGKWGRPDVVGEKIQNDPARQAVIREYLEHRVKAAHKPDAQLKLAAWCEQNGLKEQALAHYTETIKLDPSRESAWKHLGYKKQGRRWVKPEEAAIEKAQAEHQKHADKQWKPRLQRLRDNLESNDSSRRAKAQQELAEVTDSRAVPMIWAVFVSHNEQSQLSAIQMLGQIDSPEATSALAVLAVFNTRPIVRGLAASTLARRDPRDYVGRLISLVRKPFKYTVRPVNGPGSVGELFVEGERFNVRRLYELQGIENPARLQRFYPSSVPFDPFSMQNVLMASVASGAMSYSLIPQVNNASAAAQAVGPNPGNAPAILNGLVHNPANHGISPGNVLAFNTQAIAAQRDIQVARTLDMVRQANDNLQQRLASDLQMVEMTNSQINQINDSALPILKSATGQDLGVEPDAWKGWWTNEQGYAYQSSLPEYKPTYTDFVSVPSLLPIHGSCFVAGTLVQTADGPRAIESIQVGDRVLSQNTTTGLLAFQPAVGVHRNKPTPILRLAIGDESIVATGIHRFWKAGKGWTMARDLKAGDRLRMIGGVATIRSIESDQAQPVFNLDVAENRDFFVGTNGLLVHDFSFVQPVLEPFDREPDLAALVPSVAPAGKASK
jgi:Pretoxin HINT domain/HEAT repeats